MTDPHSSRFETVVDRPFRVIHSLLIEFGPTVEFIIPINQEGRSRKERVYSHSKDREIDLREGDTLEFEKDGKTEIRKITKISAYRQSFYEERPSSFDGYLVEQPEAK